MGVLIDSSIWIDYFRGIETTEVVDLLIEENLVVTNDLVLCELIPFLHQQKCGDVIKLLREVRRYPVTIDWDDITQMQITCLGNGINGVGIPDLIIAQHAIRNHLSLLAADKHFGLMARFIPLAVYED